jgi:hypothetical protein
MQKVSLIFVYKFCPKYFSLRQIFSELRAETRVGIHEKCPLLLFDFNKKSEYFNKFE